MKKKIGFMLVFLILFSRFCVFAQSDDSSINMSGDVEAYLKGEYNRGYHNYGEISLIGSVELFDQLSFTLGAAYGSSSRNNDVNLFFKAGYAPFTPEYLSPLGFSLLYIYNGMIDFAAHTHSLLPVVSYNTQRFGISLGMNFRFSSFFGETAQVETVFSFYLYYNFICNDDFSLGLGIGNFNNFDARNMGAIWLNLNTVIRINENWSVLAEIELKQSGIDGLAANFYGASLKGGARFSW